MTLRKGNIEVLLEKVAFGEGDTMNGVVVVSVLKTFECKGNLSRSTLGVSPHKPYCLWIIQISWFEFTDRRA